ncbi:conserved hypothetical protein [Sphingomonas sp. EC-HK361]|uniref:hypothetical protein n=1 Tax=Sphingomonas sp. EC-HK361 TaxID=2038397 RepID=UPI00125C9466|nr:hypothetical protein [Sphingomonas sp. EC-HK361]VVS96674.1 conserved hypothetical protein [Sphingomonas sp. EC-HK361]
MLLDHLNWRVKTRWHARVVRGVIDTPPMIPRDDGVILFSMIGTQVVLPYLVAVKSFAVALGRGRVVIVDDGTLTDADRALLAHHLGQPRIIPIASVDTGPCPRGGTWERLLTILDLRRDDYVIQLDSDTVTFGDVPEVAAAIDAGRSFMLRGEESATLMPMSDFPATLAPEVGPRVHIQHAIEMRMDAIALPGVARPLYARGCSGFAGFAPSRGGRALAEAFSLQAQAMLGPRWAEWGTEQVTSNVVIANSGDPLLLPYGRYLNFWGEALPADRRFVHFVGTCRFDGRVYLDATNNAIRALSAA